MAPNKIQYVALALAGLALVVAIVGCFIPAAADAPEASDDVTALIVAKTDAYVSVSVDANKSGSLEVWSGGQFAGYVNYSAGDRVYIVQMNDFIRTLPITSLEIRYR